MSTPNEVELSVAISARAKQGVSERLSDRVSSSCFDYDCLHPSVAKFLKGQAARIQRQCVSSIIQIGKALLESKRYLSHGAFLSWIEGEVSIPVRTAQSYMRVATWATGKSATVAHLSPTVLYLLSASGTPEEFVTDILTRAEAGEYVTPSVMRKELKAWQRQERREAERFAPQVPPEESTLAYDTAQNNDHIDGVNELVAILMRGLSAADFARVREIITSKTVLSDPDLAIPIWRNISAAFSAIGETTDRPPF
jgi:hypothetical protein